MTMAHPHGYAATREAAMAAFAAVVKESPGVADLWRIPGAWPLTRCGFHYHLIVMCRAR